MIGGIEVWREGSRWVWECGPTQWQWQSVGSGGELRPGLPALVPPPPPPLPPVALPVNNRPTDPPKGGAI
jgi:hypothetical protein